jgi:phage terminase large subunit-like protein
MKTLEALVVDGRLHHDGDPVLAWMISNVIAVQKPRSNIFPDKESPDRKIDGAMVLMFCLSRMAVVGTAETDIDLDFI